MQLLQSCPFPVSVQFHLAVSRLPIYSCLNFELVWLSCTNCRYEFQIVRTIRPRAKTQISFFFLLLIPSPSSSQATVSLHGETLPPTTPRLVEFRAKPPDPGGVDARGAPGSAVGHQVARRHHHLSSKPHPRNLLPR